MSEIQLAKTYSCTPCNTRYIFVSGDWSNVCARCKKEMTAGPAATVETLGAAPVEEFVGYGA